MASSDDKKKDTGSANPRHRSHRGCWTCKRKRVQCDEARPRCQKCIIRGIVCEGYEIRLRWVAGIASRGRYNGAEKPVKEFIPPPPKRRRRVRGKREKKEEGDRQGQPDLVASSFSPDQSPSQSVSPRATVNILNEAYGQDPKDTIGITKYFELPASAQERFERDNSALFGGNQQLATVQYTEPALSGAHQ
ncbi:Zn(II)2Cys6 transcription factor domain-containing protein [Aspergillus puulaauensis]|uniref:Zn(2)-C6 fungal-type domain-containing protein n=1 Tax=Aspergillus puulaauensis TaxID=1220207 RepID=A0A7R7XVP9_9EURO|nr:uncharacterized protein APUU_60811S [Aspergillus puulaauensis]BCS27763.1 hypothetical protein APUU_60811S [Aspergillus puulaauensis]